MHQHSRSLAQDNCRLENKNNATNEGRRLPYDFRTTVLACITLLATYVTMFTIAQTVSAKNSPDSSPSSIKDLENATIKWGALALVACILSVASACQDKPYEN